MPNKYFVSSKFDTFIDAFAQLYIIRLSHSRHPIQFVQCHPNETDTDVQRPKKTIISDNNPIHIAFDAQEPQIGQREEFDSEKLIPNPPLFVPSSC